MAYTDKIILDRLDPRSPLPDHFLEDYVVIDTETTGLSHNDCRIIELGFARYENGILTDTLSTLVNPGCSIPLRASMVNNIFDCDICDAPTYEEISPVVAEWLLGKFVVGHNVTFDLHFLEDMLVEAGYHGRIKYLDTMSLARFAFPDLEHYRLGDLTDFLNIPLENAHRAFDDAVACRDVFMNCLSVTSGIFEKIEKEKAAYRKMISRWRSDTYGKSLLYDKNVYFIGHFQRDEDLLRSLPGSVGGYVVSEFSPSVDYIVIGDPETEDDSKRIDLIRSHCLPEQNLIDEYELHRLFKVSCVRLGVNSSKDDTSDPSSEDYDESLSLSIFDPIKPALRAVAESNWLSPNSVSINDNKQTFSLSFSGSVFARVPKRKTIKRLEIFTAPDRPFEKIPLSSWSDIALYSDMLCSALQSAIDRIPKGFSCCSRYIECSDLRMCCHPDYSMREQCYYRKVLKSGRVFYGKNAEQQ